jgi:site-specific DNA-methyltransferase (adenine-specific)
MGKHWDTLTPQLFQEWSCQWGPEALRVTKPGGYLLAFGGTRTHHRLVCGLEDAGWIIRDELDWIYASGFPKGKANLKPAHEPIVLARKPGPLRPLAIDECRIGYTSTADSDDVAGKVSKNPTGKPGLYGVPGIATFNQGGRWPSNLLLSDPELFDEPNPYVVGSGATAPSAQPYQRNVDGKSMFWNRPMGEDAVNGYGDSGGYSRFFIVPKAARKDREQGMNGNGKDRLNTHPTVKPVDLMRHLVRLVTPTGGTVLDCFLGSGSTALAAELEGFQWIGIEKEPEYVKIAEARLNGTQKGLGLDTPLVGEPRKTVDGVAVRHNSGGKTFGTDTDKPPLPDMTYRQPRAEPVPVVESTSPIWTED